MQCSCLNGMRVSEPDARHTEEKGDNVPVGPVNATDEQPQPQASVYMSRPDGTGLQRAVPCEKGLFDLCYVWNPQAANVRQANGQEGNQSFPPERRRFYDTRRRCSNCFDRNPDAGSFPHEGWTSRMINCEYCGSSLFGS